MQFGLSFYLIDHRLLALAIVAVLVAIVEIVYRWGAQWKETPDSLRSQVSGIGAAMLGILGVLLGFTLSMAIARWDARREVIIEEANAIGTLWMRAGLLEEPLREELRSVLHDYTDTRIALGGSRGDLDALRTAQSEGVALHTKIWSVITRADQPGTSPAILSTLITAANELIDLHELRVASIENYLPPFLILLLPGVTGVAVAALAWSFGTTTERGRTPIFLLTLLICTVILLIMDVNRPQRGAIGVGVNTLERVQESISPSKP